MKKTDEKMLLLAIIGSLETIKAGATTIDEMENFLFSPYMVGVLKDKKCNKKIVKIIEKGCELEDIESLLPEKLHMVIDELKEETILLMKNYEECIEMFWLEN